MSGRITVTPPLPAAATDLSFAIAEKELSRSLTEMRPAPDVAAGELAVAEPSWPGPSCCLNGGAAAASRDEQRGRRGGRGQSGSC